MGGSNTKEEAASRRSLSGLKFDQKLIIKHDLMLAQVVD